MKKRNDWRFFVSLIISFSTWEKNSFPFSFFSPLLFNVTKLMGIVNRKRILNQRKIADKCTGGGEDEAESPKNRRKFINTNKFHSYFYIIWMTFTNSLLRLLQIWGLGKSRPFWKRINRKASKKINQNDLWFTLWKLNKQFNRKKKKIEFESEFSIWIWIWNGWSCPLSIPVNSFSPGFIHAFTFDSKMFIIKCNFNAKILKARRFAFERSKTCLKRQKIWNSMLPPVAAATIKEGRGIRRERRKRRKFNELKTKWNKYLSK